MRFELFSHEHEFTKEVWERFVTRALHRTHYFDHFTIEIVFGVGEVTFFLHAKNDFSRYANELLPFILQKTDKEGEPLPVKPKFCFVDFSGDENVIRLKEREELRKGRELKRAFFTFWREPFMQFCRLDLYFTTQQGQVYHCVRRFLRPRLGFLAIDFGKSIKYKKKSMPLYVKLQQVMDFFVDEKEQGMLEVLGFPYLSSSKFFPIAQFDVNKHTLIMGQTGTGKSKMIELYTRELYKYNFTDEYTIVVLDPHATLFGEFNTFPGVINIDFVHSACKLFAQIGEPNIATELTILLFKTLMKDQFNGKMERVLKYTLFVLFLTNKMSLETLRGILTDVVTRKEILMDPAVTPALNQFFDTDFTELQTKFYEIAIMPILTLLDELTFLPISNFQDAESLEDIINGHSLVFLSLHQMSLGSKATKLIAGLLIQQIFLLAQGRKLKKKLLFIIDEVSVVQNDSLAAILSEARKYGLSLILTQQYLNQVDEYILRSIVTNVYNYFLFKISEDDAKVLANNLEFDFPEDILNSKYLEKGLLETDLKLKMMTTLNPRECLVRFYGQGKLRPVFKARTMDIVPIIAEPPVSNPASTLTPEQMAPPPSEPQLPISLPEIPVTS